MRVYPRTAGGTTITQAYMVADMPYTLAHHKDMAYLDYRVVVIRAFENFGFGMFVHFSLQH